MIKTSKFGFTFVELLLVVALIAIFSSFAIPQFKKSVTSLELDNFVKDIYFLSRFLEESAIGQGKIHYLNVDPSQGKFWAEYNKTGDKFEKLDGRFGRVYKAPKNIVVSLKRPVSPDQKGVYFYPDGSSEDAEIIFTNQEEKKVYIIIKGTSGAIKIK